MSYPNFYKLIYQGNLSEIRKIVDGNSGLLSERGHPKGLSPLLFSVAINNMKIAKYLLRKGADIDCFDNGGKGPLHYAAASGNKRMLKFLIEEKASLNHLDDFERSALHLAVYEGRQLNAVKYLVSKKLEVAQADCYGRTALHYAAFSAKIAILKFIVDLSEKIDVCDDMNKTPLHFSLSDGKNLECVKFLLQNGADMHATDISMKTALHFAAYGGETAILKFLLKKGLEINVTDDAGLTPLHCAIQTEEKRKVKFIKLMISNGVDFRAQDNCGKTVLHFCAEHGQLDILRYFIKIKGMDINRPSSDGQSLLHFAAQKGQLDIVKYLHLQLDMDVDPTVPSNNATPLYFACAEGHLSVVKYLINNWKADFYAKLRNGWTIMHGAAFNGNLEVIAYLRVFFDVNVRSSAGLTPLHVALLSKNCKVETLDELIKWGGDTAAQDNKGRNLLHIAAPRAKTHILVYIIDELKIDINHVDQMGWSALKYAEKKGEIANAQLLLKRGAKKQDLDEKKL